MARFSEKKTEEAIKKWFKDMHGDEVFLQGLFYSNNSIGIHKKILEGIKFSDGEEFYFSRIKNGSLNKGKNDEHNLWHNEKSKEEKKNKKNGKEKEKKKNWWPDGYIICSSDKAKKDITGLVEFKGTYNVHLRHNDIAKLIQYLYFCGCEKKYLLWFGQKSMIEDIMWLCLRFTKNKINDNFFEVCNHFKQDDYKDPKAESLSGLYNDIKNGPKVRQPADKSVGSYNTKQFEKILRDGQHKEEIEKAIRKYLILINYDKCPVEPAEDSGQMVRPIDLQKLVPDKEKKFDFFKYINEAEKNRPKS